MWTAAAQPPTRLTSRALRRDELIVMEEMHTLYSSLENKSYEQADTFGGKARDVDRCCSATYTFDVICHDTGVAQVSKR